MNHFLTRYLLCLMLFNLAACSSMQTVDVESTMQNANARGIDYGSLVEVRTLDRKTAKFRVSDITEVGLGGNKGFYRYENMLSLKVEKQATRGDNDTLAWVLGILGITALVFLVANADSAAVCVNQPCPPR